MQTGRMECKTLLTKFLKSPVSLYGILCSVHSVGKGVERGRQTEVVSWLAVMKH